MDTHKVWHDFCKRFTNGETYDIKWHFTGHELMKKTEKWAKKWPKDVEIIRCDDSVHASSILILISHKLKSESCGTTVVYVPQCCGDPAVMFFYSSHEKALIKALKKLS